MDYHGMSYEELEDFVVDLKEEIHQLRLEREELVENNEEYGERVQAQIDTVIDLLTEPKPNITLAINLLKKL